MPRDALPPGTAWKQEKRRTVYRVPEPQRPYGDTFTHYVVVWTTTDWRGDDRPGFIAAELTPAQKAKWIKKALRALGLQNALMDEDRDTSSMAGAFRSYVTRDVIGDGQVRVTSICPSTD